MHKHGNERRVGSPVVGVHRRPSPSPLAPAGSLLADGDSRPATAKEKDFYSQVAGAFAKAVPAGPAGWAEGRDGGEPPGSVGVDAGNTRSDFVPGVLGRRQAARRGGAQKQLEALGKIHGRGRIRASGVDAPQREARRGTRRALSQGRPGQGGARRQGYRRTAGEVSARVAVQDARITEAAAFDQPTRRGTFRCALREPVFRVVLRGLRRRVRRSGAALVYRSKGISTRIAAGARTTYVFLGKGWQSQEGRQHVDGGAAAVGPPSTAVQTIVVSVKANPPGPAPCLEQLDWEALQKLLAKVTAARLQGT